MLGLDVTRHLRLADLANALAYRRRLGSKAKEVWLRVDLGHSWDEGEVLGETADEEYLEISFELAPLLEEHHSLQEEVDARNVVIHQLLKLTCKQAEFPHRPIQMSVIFPDNKAEALVSDAASDN
ncbi:hypothetical protein HPB47_009331 [Ixodes persulcatus]|uniref:Uncharacterized protein n=1 Tax=Ixodes persulcatus TaxID=34615 RepID=A0AC60P2D2_IXOPE|nr:hypothetical protein HPB47_009331 [Ixodes persulcatus]